MPTTSNKRLTITLTNERVDNAELLRSLLEKRLSERLSIAEVATRLINSALDNELKLTKS